jgi:hypothetical protein
MTKGQVILQYLNIAFILTASCCGGIFVQYLNGAFLMMADK